LHCRSGKNATMETTIPMVPQWESHFPMRVKAFALDWSICTTTKSIIFISFYLL
jgi:hypothetical protein